MSKTFQHKTLEEMQSMSVLSLITYLTKLRELLQDESVQLEIENVKHILDNKQRK